MADKRFIEFEPIAKTSKFNKEIEKSGKLQEKHIKKTLKLTEKWDKAVRGVSKDVKSYGAAAEAAYATANELQEALLSAHEDDQRLVKKSIANLKLQAKELERIRDENKEIRDEARKRAAIDTAEIRKAKQLLTVREAIAAKSAAKEARGMSAIREVAEYGGHEMGEEMADAMKDALGSITSRDFSGFAGGLMKAIGAAGKGLAGAGMRAGAAGGDAGALGKVMGKMGGVLQTVAKLGPLITTLSSIIMSVVKFFLDADAAAKEFNKSVLDTTGSADFLSGNLGKANAAAEDLKGTMRDMFVQATSLDNLQWGISKETHSQVIGALGAEGVQLKKNADYFRDISEGTAKAAGTVKDWGSAVQMSVGYSRVFGVSLSEITSFQGEMMTELGQNFDQVEASMQLMTDGTKDAGVGANKFFAQIRAISADMNLFNLRMEDSVKLMSKLDKVMSPRKAAEFFNTITGFMKGMGLMDRTKMVLLAGKGATKDILQKDLKGRLDGLAADIDLKLGKGSSQKIIKNGKIDSKNLVKWMAKNDKKLDGSTRDALITAMRQQGKLQAGGLIDMGSALKDASPMATIKMLDKVAITRFGKPVDQLTDIQREAFSQITGFNDEQQDQFAKFKTSLDLNRETLAQKIEDGADLTEDEKNLLKKLGIAEKGADAAQKLRDTDAEKVFDNMDKNQQDALREAAGTMDFAKKQGELTQSIIDKLSVLMDWLMGKLYPIFADIWDSILDLMDKIGAGDADRRKLGKIQAQAIRDGNQGIADLAGKAESAEDFRQKMLKQDPGNVGKNLLDVGAKLQAAIKTEQDLIDKRSKEQSSDERDNIEKQLKANDVTKKALQEQFSKMSKAIAQQVGGARDASGMFGTGIQTKGGLLAARSRSAGSMAGLDAAKIDKLAKILEEGKTEDVSVAADLAGFDIGDTGKLLEKLRLTLSPEQLGKAIGDATKGDPQQVASDNSGGTSAQTQTATQTPTTPAGQQTGGQSVAQQAAQAPSGKPVTPDDMKEQTDQTVDGVQDALDGVRLAVKKQSGGVVFNGPYLKNTYGPQIEESVYNAASRALFEYYMYSDLDREDALKAIKSGVNPRDIGASFLDAMKKAPDFGILTPSRGDILGSLKPNADGGTVTGPLPGNEMLALVGKGEKIVPAGAGGGQTIRLELAGDLKRIIRAETLNTLNEHDRARPRR